MPELRFAFAATQRSWPRGVSVVKRPITKLPPEMPPRTRRGAKAKAVVSNEAAKADPENVPVEAEPADVPAEEPAPTKAHEPEQVRHANLLCSLPFRLSRQRLLCRPSPFKLQTPLLETTASQYRMSPQPQQPQ